MSNKRVKPFTVTASAVIAAQSSTPQAVSVHSMVLSETAGTTNETFIFYVPTPKGDGGTAANASNVASASGTKVMEVIVPKGTSVPLPGLGDGEGLYFENGLYVACSGGTPVATLSIS
jgi:hypothetical protein